MTSFIVLNSSFFIFTSCEDMMTVETGDKAYINANDTLYSYLGIMRAMQDIAERQIVLGEIRGDLVAPSEYATDTLYAISNFDAPQDLSCSMLNISDYYNVINNCNFYIHNCDTSAVKANIKYMIPEYTQVKAVRAWTYLQLVKNYKEVPYITEPITNLDVINNFDYKSNVVNKDNLIDKLIEDGLPECADINYPHYGNSKEEWGKWNNGSVDISARLGFIPINIVLGDAYLLRGANKTDYMKAASFYYSFLKKENTPMPLQLCGLFKIQGRDDYQYSAISGSSQFWGEWASTYSYSSSNEVITSIPSSANAGFGKMLTRAADIFGYAPSSHQSNEESTTTNDDGTESTEYNTSGAIIVSPTYKRQYAPSYAYEDVNNSQTYVGYEELISGKEPTPVYYENMDARTHFSYTDCHYKGESYHLCGKVSSTSFYYTIPVYRKTLIWLRLAEAINRAGFPEFAFALLKDGINRNTLPHIATAQIYKSVEIEGNPYYLRVGKENNDTLYVDPTVEGFTTCKYYDEDNNFVDYTTKFLTADYPLQTTSTRILAHNSINSMYYVTDSVRLKEFNQFLDFSDDMWESTYGIHARGCGFYYRNFNKSLSAWNTTDYLTTNISGTRDTIAYDYYKLVEKKCSAKKAFSALTQDEVIDAVENIIVDELALETAFEGNRFTDLVRIAEHKADGVEWLAKKIANRGTKAAVKNYEAVDGFDASIYAKLKNKKNWYFTLPSWKK